MYADALSLLHPASSVAELGANLSEGDYGRALAVLPFVALDAATMGKGKAVGSGVKGATKMPIEDVGKFLGGGKNWHQTNLKKDYIKKFEKLLKGDTNADFYLNKDTKEVFIKSNKSGIWVDTGQKIK